MAKWWFCAGGQQLLDQIDAKFPNRDRRSDGRVSSAAHREQNSNSDHDPDPKTGVVRAMDVDENMGVGIWRNGRMAKRLADEILLYASSGLPGSRRVKYVIYEGAIASGTLKRLWWKWRPGNWGHHHHIHISFTPAADYDASVWPLPVLAASEAQAKKWAAALVGK